MLVKKSERQARRGSLASLAAHSNALDRRAFLRRSGIGAGSLAVLGMMPLGTIRKAEAAAAGLTLADAAVRNGLAARASKLVWKSPASAVSAVVFDADRSRPSQYRPELSRIPRPIRSIGTSTTSASTRSAARLLSRAPRIASNSTSRRSGFVRNSTAPAFMAFTMAGMSPCQLMKTMQRRD